MHSHAHTTRTEKREVGFLKGQEFGGEERLGMVQCV